MKKQCRTCDHWIELIDNGQCKIDKKLYCEFDDCCESWKKKTKNYMAEILKKYGRNK